MRVCAFFRRVTMGLVVVMGLPMTVLRADVVVRRVQHMSGLVFLTSSYRVTWYLKDHKMARYESKEGLLGIINTEATIYDFEKKKVWEVDFSEETYREYSWDEYQKKKLGFMQLVPSLVDSLSDAKIRYMNVAVTPLENIREIAGRKTRGLTIQMQLEGGDPFTSDLSSATLIMTIWMTKIDDKNDPLRKYYEVHDKIYGTDSNQDGQMEVLQVLSKKFDSLFDISRKTQEMMNALTTMFGDTSNLYTVGMEMFLAVGDPLDASSPTISVYFSDFTVDVSTEFVPDSKFEVPEGYTLKEDDEDEDMWNEE